MNLTRHLRRFEAARADRHLAQVFLNLALLTLVATITFGGVFQTETSSPWSRITETLSGNSRLASNAPAPLAVLPKTANTATGEALRASGDAKRPRILISPLALLPAQNDSPARILSWQAAPSAFVFVLPATPRAFDSRGPPSAA